MFQAKIKAYRAAIAALQFRIEDLMTEPVTDLDRETVGELQSVVQDLFGAIDRLQKREAQAADSKQAPDDSGVTFDWETPFTR